MAQFNSIIENGKFFIPNEKINDKFTKFVNLLLVEMKLKFIMTITHQELFSTKFQRILVLYRIRFFFEFFINNLRNISKNVNPKFQTMTYFGFKESELRNFILEEKPTGIDELFLLDEH